MGTALTCLAAIKKIILTVFVLLLVTNDFVCLNSQFPYLASYSALQIDSPPITSIASKSYLLGVSDIPLLSKTVGQCLEETTLRYPEREGLVFPQEGIRKTFSQFKQDVSKIDACVTEARLPTCLQ